MKNQCPYIRPRQNFVGRDVFGNPVNEQSSGYERCRFEEGDGHVAHRDCYDNPYSHDGPWVLSLPIVRHSRQSVDRTFRVLGVNKDA